jgi:hypothetical protein
MNFALSTLQDKEMAETIAVRIFITLLQLQEFIHKFVYYNFSTIRNLLRRS